MKKVLIVDDNQAAADGLTRLLKAMGYEAQAVYSGTEFLELLPIANADIAFIDIGMPVMDGYETVRNVRKEGHLFPIVALSGYGQSEDKENALACGFNSHLTKPVGVQEIRATLAELL
jgi:CheY-like chemotaxis protein